MATTTNYSWTTPDDTALVKDGAAAIRSLGTAIDTTVFNNASAGIAKTIVDAKGDIIAATAADTVSRLAVGANNTVLTADSTTATGLKWAAPAAGSLTLLSTTSLSGATTTVTISDATYKHLQIFIFDVTNATNNDVFKCKPNNAENVAQINSSYSASDTAYVTGSGADALQFNHYSVDPTRTDDDNAWVWNIYNYASTSLDKVFSMSGAYVSGGYRVSIISGGKINTTSAITSLVFSNAGGNLSTGTVQVYGVN